MDTGIGILSASYYLPPTRKAVADIFRDEEIPQEKLAADVDFQRDIGIEAVHVAGKESAASLALEASRRALQQAALDPKEIDLIFDFTSIPEEYPAPTWSAAGLLQKELGATRALATAVNTGGCASYHTTLKVACAMMAATDRYQTALLFAGDKVPEFNHTYYPITVICDGGSAVILQKGHEKRRILSVEVATAGKIHDVWYIPGFHNRERGDTKGKWLHMTADVPKFNKEVIPINLFMFRKVMRDALARIGRKQHEVSYYVYPTFSTWDQKAFCNAFMIPPEKIFTEGLQRHGHLQETDMVLDYVDALEEGHIKEGDLVMLTTNGAGFSWGAALIQH
ncbi:MAG TPA: 3-oxoacyl-[acyl-carrier-protein] synthase III C-terminal domain-containing protein [Terriglobales bacterium]|nr:3-oxoacyl-[acyl-carrier-protein] synthase III C-terminal domain-containing protein [Terriglobales bacterium]